MLIAPQNKVILVAVRAAGLRRSTGCGVRCIPVLKPLQTFGLLPVHAILEQIL